MKQPTIYDVKEGDIVICCDEYSHDYIEHEFRVTSIEEDEDYATEEDPKGIRLYGEDLDDDSDEYIGVVHIGNFLGIKNWE